MLPFVARSSVGSSVESAEIAKEAITAEKVKATEIATLGAESNVFTGKVGFNGAAAVGKAADTGASATNLNPTLLTEVPAMLNTANGHINDIRTVLRNAGLMS